jgi:hypothetical protein
LAAVAVGDGCRDRSRDVDPASGALDAVAFARRGEGCQLARAVEFMDGEHPVGERLDGAVG